MRGNLRNARKAAGLTQQQMADKLGIGLRHYKYIESGKILGAIWIWDLLEDITDIHQRTLRENEEIHPGREGSQPIH